MSSEYISISGVATPWQAGPSSPVLSSDVHLWLADLSPQMWDLRALHSLLSVEELQRAKKLYRLSDRHAYVLAHGLLRLLLARYLAVKPDELRFRNTGSGKPMLMNNPIHFNLSHSGSRCLFAIARDRQVGVDLEQVREDLEIDSIARLFFAPSEVALIGALPNDRRLQTFYDLWTSKEALAKATGNGLPHLLDQPHMIWPAHSDDATVCVNAKVWSLIRIELGSAYRAALVIEGQRPPLSCWLLLPSVIAAGTKPWL